MLFKGTWMGKHLHECGQPFQGYVAYFLEENWVSFSLQPSAANSSLRRGWLPVTFLILPGRLTDGLNLVQVLCSQP